jgi:hypothetical protein
MIREELCMSYVLFRCPGFTSRWQAHVAGPQGEGPRLGRSMAAFGDYVVSLVARDDQAALAAVGELLETLIADGDEAVVEATTVHLLENISTQCRRDPVHRPMARLAQHFGPASRARYVQIRHG